MLVRRILLILLWLFFSDLALADTSLFFKLSVFRFTKEEVVKPVDGVVDLALLGSHEIFHVQGEILFFPGEWLEPRYYTPEEFTQLIEDKQPKRMEMNLRTFPHSWPDLANYGTYVLRYKNSGRRELSLQFPRFYHPMEVYVAQSHGVSRVIRADHLQERPELNRNVNPFITSVPLIPVESDFLMFAQVSAPLRDGLSTVNISSFYIADEAILSRMVYYNRMLGCTIVGAFFFIFMFYSFIYIFRLRDLSSLYLSLFALFCFGMSSFYVVEYDWNPNQVLDRFTVINGFAIGFLQLFLLTKIHQRMGAKFYRYCSITALVAPILVTILIGFQAYLAVGLIFVLSLISSIVLTLATVYLGYRYGMNGLGFFVAGTVFNMIFQFPIMVSFIKGDNSENGYIILLANFFMAVGLALVNAKEFAVTYKTSIKQGRELEKKNREITFFNKNLEKLVAAKTKEIQSLLDHIPQGVLSIGKNGVVSKDFSAHLSKVIGTEDIAERSFKDLILDHSSLSSDVRDQAWQTILASIGEVAINFDVNSEKLPNEIPFKVNKENKFLKATWNIDVDENDLIQQILVTLLDITIEKSLEKESEKHRKDLQILEELINVAPNKVAQFFLTSTPLLEENLRLLKNVESKNGSETIRALFVNAHTIKGAARTLQFKDLAAAIHEMEEHYNEILRHGVPIDAQRLLLDVEFTLSVMKEYRDVNRIKLGRSDDFKKVPIERDFIEKHYYLLKNIIKQEILNPDDFLKCLHEHSELLTKVIFEHLPAIFDDYKEKAIKIARDVGKAEPHFDFDVLPLWIPPETRTVLDNCMIHILRNSLDHGIESAQDRQEVGKDPAGMISIHTRFESGLIKLKIEDDGRGLAVAVLREKGLKNGILKANSSLKEVAELIFASGLTTTDKVSMVSGRGVGMDAVRSFLKKVGGNIHVVLGPPKDDHQEFFAFHIEIEIPLENMQSAA